jgi:hypothetical protein
MLFMAATFNFSAESLDIRYLSKVVFPDPLLPMIA